MGLHWQEVLSSLLDGVLQSIFKIKKVIFIDYLFISFIIIMKIILKLLIQVVKPVHWLHGY